MGDYDTTLYFRVISVFSCVGTGVQPKQSCSHNCCDGKNCVVWFEEIMRDYERLRTEEMRRNIARREKRRSYESL